LLCGHQARIYVERSDEPVTPPSQSFHKAGILWSSDPFVNFDRAVYSVQEKVGKGECLDQKSSSRLLTLDYRKPISTTAFSIK